MRTLMTVVAIAALLSLTGLCFAQSQGLLDTWGPTVSESGFHSDYGGTWGAMTDNWSRTWEPSAWSGIYTGYSDGWSTMSEGGPGSIMIAADVEMWCEETLSANNIYFHFADSREDQSTTIEGTLTSNNGQFVGLAFPGGDFGKLYNYDEDGNGGSGSADGFILEWQGAVHGDDPGDDLPVKIEFKDSDGVWKTCEGVNDSPAGSPVWALWWLLNDGAVGAQTFDYRFTPVIKDYQPDGHYGLDPAVVVAPSL